jgi:protein ImuA
VGVRHTGRLDRIGRRIQNMERTSPRPPLPDLLPDPDRLAPGRVHEATGPGRLVFALALAGRLEGPVLWVGDARLRDGLYAPGLAAFFDPARLILARPAGPLAVLQVVEEALRSGAVPLVLAELAEAPDLTASRRLQLAAGTGGGRGLCLLPEARLRSNAAETRWHCAPIAVSAAVPGGAGWGNAPQAWEIVKDKRGRLGAWQVRWQPGLGFVDAGQAVETA